MYSVSISIISYYEWPFKNDCADGAMLQIINSGKYGTE